MYSVSYLKKWWYIYSSPIQKALALHQASLFKLCATYAQCDTQ